MPPCRLFVWIGREDCKVRYLKLQRQMFRKSERELTRAEYQRLLDAAKAHISPDIETSLICGGMPVYTYYISVES